MILGGRTLPELHVSAFIAVSQCCEVVCKRKKKASTRQDDIINALPDLHDTNGNTIPKMVEYGDYDERYLRIARTMPGFQRSRA